MPAWSLLVKTTEEARGDSGLVRTCSQLSCQLVAQPLNLLLLGECVCKMGLIVSVP